VKSIKAWFSFGKGGEINGLSANLLAQATIKRATKVSKMKNLGFDFIAVLLRFIQIVEIKNNNENFENHYNKAVQSKI
jgi:hypothetical protein